MLKEIIKRKNEQRAEQIINFEESLKNDPKHSIDDSKFIISLESIELLRKLREGELTAVKVLKAFQWKALEVTKQINCITEFIPEANDWAEERDKIPIEDRKLLHGIPISVKDNFNVKGMDSTMGLAKNLYNPATSNAVLIEALIDNGAIPFCKTNIPQVLLSFCCTNPVFGTTLNPYDSTRTRTPGGSSGGEAALIASGGSILGLGTDLAGSVRVPANLSGCFSLKPTFNRLSSTGVLKGLNGMVGVTSCPGILGKDMFIIETCMRALITSKCMYNLDVGVVPIPWNETILHEPRKLTFGYYEELDFYLCTPSVKRAVREAKIALEKAGHTVVPFKSILDPVKITIEIVNIVCADAGKTITKHIKNEIWDPSISVGLISASASFTKRKILKFLVGLKSKILALSYQDDYHSTYDFWQGLVKRENYIQQFSKDFKENKIDLILSPVCVSPAPQHYVPAKILVAGYYTVLFNYLDFSSGAVPVTKETEEDQKLLAEYSEDGYHHKIVKEATRGAVGLPVGVLISGLRWQEELVCRGMMELEKALKEHNN